MLDCFEKDFFEKVLMESGRGESTNLGMSVRSSHARSNSVCVRGWHEKGRVEAEHGADVENLMKRVDPMNRPRFLVKESKDAFDANVHRTKERSPNHDMPQEQLKGFQTLGKRFFGLSENENRHSMVLRHGGTRTKMR